PPGKYLVVTRNYGQEIPSERLAEGDILAREGERGIVEEIVKPGSHRINPYAFHFGRDQSGKPIFLDFVVVHANEVGVRTSKMGKNPQTLPPPEGGRGRYVMPKGYRGVQEEVLPPGDYYPNPYVETITPVEVRSHTVELIDIEFPSADGFILKPQVFVE